MTTIAIITAGLVIWISGWALGLKSFDAFMVTVLLSVIAASIRLFGPSVKQLMGRASSAPEEQEAP